MDKIEKLPFDQVFVDDTKNGTKIKKEDYLKEGKYPIVDQSRDNVSGYTNDENGVYKNVPVIAFGDHTRIIKYVDFPFFLGADGVKILKIITDKFKSKFLYYYLRNIKIPDTGYNRHFKWLKEIEVPLIDLKKQLDIVTTLERVEQILFLNTKKFNEMNNLIKSIFYEMFGDPVSNDKSWEVYQLKEVIINIKYGASQPPKYTTEGYYFIRATNIKSGRIVTDDIKMMSREESKKFEKCKLSLGDLIIVRSGVNTGDTCVIDENFAGHYAGYDLIISPNPKKVNSIFLNELINTNYMTAIIKPLTRRAAQPHLNAEQVKKLKVIVPPLDLQNQFAEIVTKIEEQKALVKKAIEETQTLFDSLMSNYFDD